MDSKERNGINFAHDRIEDSTLFSLLPICRDVSFFSAIADIVSLDRVEPASRSADDGERRIREKKKKERDR